MQGFRADAGGGGRLSPRAAAAPGARATPSCSAACCHGFAPAAAATRGGAVARMNRSSAATTAAASSGEAPGATIVSWGGGSWPAEGIVPRRCPTLPVLDHAAVLAAVSPAARSSASATRSCACTRGDWSMPSKVYLHSPPYGDFRAMPARGGGFALLKWITSFPGNPARGCRR